MTGLRNAVPAAHYCKFEVQPGNQTPHGLAAIPQSPCCWTWTSAWSQSCRRVERATAVILTLTRLSTSTSPTRGPFTHTAKSAIVISLVKMGLPRSASITALSHAESDIWHPKHNRALHCWQCSICDRVLKSEDALKQHHRDSENHAFCRRCDRFFASREGLRAHRRDSQYHGGSRIATVISPSSILALIVI